MDRDLGRRQSGHLPGDVRVLTGTWGGDSQGTGPDMWQYSLGPGEETVRALARRCGSTHWDLGRRQSGHWPGDVAVLRGGEQSGHLPGDVGSFYIDSTHISFIFGSILVDECRLLPCVYLCIILTFKYQLFVSYWV